jgi:hypothetical protein
MSVYINPARVMSYSLTKTELARYTKGLDVKYHLVARLRWALDETAVAPLVKMLRTEVTRWAIEEKWSPATRLMCPSCGNRLQQRIYIKRLAELAVLEMERPENFSRVKEKWQWLGCSESTWYRWHRRRYGIPCNYLQNWLSEAFVGIGRNQREASEKRKAA